MKSSTILIYLNYLGIYSFHKSVNAMKKYSDPETISKATPNVLEKDGFTGKQIEKINTSLETFNIHLEKSESFGVKTIDYFDPQFPEKLKLIYSPPTVIHTLGDLKLLENFSAALVGARKASSEGKNFSYKLSKSLSKAGVTIISGLAYGIDTKAHEGALEHQGSTVTVLGSGINMVYPKSNLKLYEKIKNEGLVLSEYPLNTQGQKYFFPARNRIISGLSDSVIVIEASERSGSLITAEYALDQSKDIFAVPGSIYDKRFVGSNNLIKSGAIPITCSDDFLSYYDIPIEKSRPKINCLSSSSLEIFNFIKYNQPVDEEVIFHNIDLPYGEVASILTILEIDGYIEKLTATIYIAN